MENINDLFTIIIPILISFCFMSFGMKIIRFLVFHCFDVYLDDEDTDEDTYLESELVDFHNSNNKGVPKDDIDEDTPIRYF